MFRPDHIYIPSVTERHAEDTFEAICDTAGLNSSVDELAHSSAFKHGLMYLEEGYFWEAHEVLEPVWMALAPNSEERRFVQGLIQLANASLKLKMQRPKAVARLCGIARELLTNDNIPIVMNIDRAQYLNQIDQLEQKIR